MQSTSTKRCGTVTGVSGGKFGATTGSVHVRSYKNNVYIYININGTPLRGHQRKEETIEAAVQRLIESEEPGAKFERLELGSETVRRRDVPAAAAVSMPRRRPRRDLFDPSKLMRPGELARMQGSQTTGRRRGPPHVSNGRPMFGRPPRRRPETPPAAADECAICLEDLDDASPALACGHKFHAACMRQLADAAWGDGNAPRTRGGTHVRCPLCQKQMRI